MPPDLFAQTVRALPASGFAGANVTLPHKEAALALADDAEPAARAIGAANTLSFENGQIFAANTDAPGLLAALPESPQGRTALVLGAGGSARAAAWALREAGATVTVWNRSTGRAETLAAELGVTAITDVEGAELLVNCTAVGLGADDDPFALLPVTHAVLRAARCVVDLAYGDRETRLLAAAREAGAATVDGLEVLVHQGALSLERWTGAAAPIEVMRAAARRG